MCSFQLDILIVFSFKCICLTSLSFHCHHRCTVWSPCGTSWLQHLLSCTPKITFSTRVSNMSQWYFRGGSSCCNLTCLSNRIVLNIFSLRQEPTSNTPDKRRRLLWKSTTRTTTLLPTIKFISMQIIVMSGGIDFCRIIMFESSNYSMWDSWVSAFSIALALERQHNFRTSSNERTGIEVIK